MSASRHQYLTSIPKLNNLMLLRKTLTMTMLKEQHPLTFWIRVFTYELAPNATKNEELFIYIYCTCICTSSIKADTISIGLYCSNYKVKEEAIICDAPRTNMYHHKQCQKHISSHFPDRCPLCT